MSEPAVFKCLRCGHTWKGTFNPDAERMCPECRSNSVRRMKEGKGNEPIRQPRQQHGVYDLPNETKGGDGRREKAEGSKQ